MLQRHIDVRTELFLICHEFEKFVRYAFGAAVKHTHPLDGRNGAGLFYKFAKTRIFCGVLSNEIYLFCTVERKRSYLVENVLERARLKFSSDGRYDAVCAMI